MRLNQDVDVCFHSIFFEKIDTFFSICILNGHPLVSPHECTGVYVLTF